MRSTSPVDLAEDAGTGVTDLTCSNVHVRLNASCGVSPTVACDILPDDQAAGRAAGVACAASGTADVVDAIVIVTAVRHQAPVVTSDPGDLTRIADSIGVKIRLFPT